jgi:uncharacterized delta-60 repeat protein
MQWRWEKDIALDSQGNVLIAGVEDYYWSVTKTDYIIIKCNSGGDTLWIRKYNSPQNGFDYLCAIAVDDSDNIYVTGYTYVPAGNYDIITIKYNNDGAMIWDRIFQGPANGDDVVYAMVVDSLGNVYLTGNSFVTGNGIDCLTIKYNSSGVLQWAKTYAEYSNHSDGANSLAVDKSGNVYITGVASTSSSNTAYLTIKYDKDGNEKWITKYDGPAQNGYDVANSVCVDNSGNVYVAGTSTGTTSATDIATIKYIQAPSDVDDNLTEPPMNFELFQNFPNPFNPATTISWQLPIGSQATLKVYDILGREVATLVNEYKQVGKYETEFNAEALPSAVYFYRLKAGNYLNTKKMILLK